MATISKSVAEFKAVRTTLTEADSVTVSDTSAKIKASLGALLNDVKVDQIVSTDGKEIKVAINQLGFDLSKLVKFTAADNVTVTGSSADISKSIGTFFSSEAVKHIDSTQQSYVKINVAQEQVAANMAKLLAADKISIVDTTANIQSKLSALLADAKIDLIDSSETSAINLKVADLTTANLAKLMLNDTIAVSDTTANIQANLASLLSNSKVDSINSVASTTITLSAEQLTQSNINKLSADDTIKVVLTSEDKVLTADQITLLKDAKIDSYSNAYTVSSKVADATSSLVDEGGQITFTISAIAPVEKDTTFTYQIQGDTSNAASASDVTPAFGKVTILAGQLSKSISVNAVSDGLVEFNEGAIFKLLDSTGSKQIASAPFSIQDGASYSFSAPVVSANEGSTVEFSLNTTNVADGTEISYVLSGVNVTASDFVNNSLTGTATVSGGVATISVPLANDLKTEGAETLKVTAQGKSSTVTINDTSLDANYTITANQAKADEGTDATFSIVTNAPDGSTIPYTLSGTGITTADVGTSALAGEVTVTGGAATITLPLVKDTTTEGDEILTVTLTASGKTATTTITDKSVAPTLVNDIFQVVPGAQGTVAALIKSSDLLANDFDSTGTKGALTGEVSIVGGVGSGVNGSTSLNQAGDILFTPAAGQTQGSFEYSVAGVAGTATANIIFNTTPKANALSVPVTEGTKATGTVTATDADVGQTATLTYTLVTGPTKGILGAIDPSTGVFTYDYTGATGAVNGALAAGVTDTDTFTYIATDSLGKPSAPETVTLTTTGIENAPASLNNTATVAVTAGQSNVTVDLSKYATDPDTATAGLVFTPGATTTKGATISLSGTTATLDYSKVTVGSGSDSFTFTVSDGKTTVPGVTVNEVITNTVPVATSFSIPSVKTGQSSTIDLLAGTLTDADGTVALSPAGAKISDAETYQTLTPTIKLGSLTAGGTATVSAGKILYTPALGFADDVEKLTYTVSDGFNNSTEQTITFNVVANTGGTAGNDNLYGSSKKAEVINGDAGNDTISGGGGLDNINGGDDNDTITFSDAAVQIQGGNGVDTLVVNSDAVASIFDFNANATNPASVVGATLTVNNQLADKNSLNSQNSHVVLLGFENLDASKAASVIFQDSAATTSVITGTGNDTVYLANSTGATTVSTGNGNDTVTVTRMGAYTVDGGAGNDNIFVQANFAANGAVIKGGLGIDSLSVAAGADIALTAVGISSLSSIENIAFLNVNNKSTVELTDAIFTANGSAAMSITAAAATGGVLGVLTVDASAVTAVNSVTVDLSGAAVNAGSNVLKLGAGNDTLKVDLTDAGTIVAAAAAGSTVGGLGTDTLQLAGGSAAAILPAGVLTTTLDADLTGFEKISFATATNTYNVTTVDANVAAGVAFTVDGSNLTTGLAFDGSAELDGKFSVTAGTGNDSLLGGAGADTLAGGTGDDALTGNGGVDVITGSAGKDTITGGAALDNLSGGDDNDTFIDLTAAAVGVFETVSGGLGTDTLQFSAGNVNVIAADLMGISSIEKIETLNSTQTFGVTLTDAVFTANGSNTLTIAATAATSGVTTVDASALTAANSVTVDLSDGVGGNAAANVLKLGAGNDTLKIDLVDAATIVAVGSTGGSGTDTLQLAGGSAAAIPPAGVLPTTLDADLINFEKVSFATATNTYNIATADANVASGATLTVDGSNLTSGVLTFDGAAELDGKFSVTGGLASDSLVGGASADTLAGGAGDDTLTGNGGADVVTGGTGKDTITGGTGLDNLSGGDDDDTFIDLTAAVAGVVDTVSGGAGNDTLQFTAGVVTVAAADLMGINSIETITTQNTTQAFGVTLTDAVFTANDAHTLTIAATSATSGVTTIDASALTAVNSVTVDLSGAAVNAGSNVLKLGAGNDTLKVDLADANTIVVAAAVGSTVGGLGSDTLQLVGGNAAAITLDADLTGFEKISFATPATAYNVATADANVAAGATFTVDGSNLTTGVLTFNGAAELDGIFSITGGSAADSLVGGAKDDALLGGVGNDTLVGSAGSDNITGGDGDDSIDGGAGTDVITAGAGNDTVNIGFGNDQISLGDGLDIINVDVTTNLTGIAVISDFNAATSTPSISTPAVDNIHINIAGDVWSGLAGAANATEVLVRQSALAGGTTANIIVMDGQFNSFLDAGVAADGLQHDTAVVDYLYAWTDTTNLVHISKGTQDSGTEVATDQFVDIVKLTGVSLANLDAGDFSFV